MMPPAQELDSSPTPSSVLPERSVVDAFGSPATTRIFVQDAGGLPNFAALEAALPGWPVQAERALLLARPGDIVCVRHAVDPDYIAFLRSLGIGPNPGDILVAGGGHARSLSRLLLDDETTLHRLATRLAGGGLPQVHPLLAEEADHELARRLARLAGRPVCVTGGDPAIVRYADQKHEMRRLARALGVSVARGQEVRLGPSGNGYARLERALRRRAARTGRALIRGAHGTSGSASRIVEDGPTARADVVRDLRTRDRNRIFLVEEFLDLTVSPNVQFYVPGGAQPAEFIGITDQRWSAPMKQAGNAFPSRSETAPQMVAAARRIAEWLGERDYDGVVGFDFGEYRDPATGRVAFILADVNPRPNGASYPLALLQRLSPPDTQGDRRPDGAFVSATLPTDARSFLDVRRMVGPELYRPGRDRGIVPYLMGALRYGRCGFIALARSRAEAEALLDPLAATVRPVAAGHTRQ